ncbi:SCP160 protein [Thelephora ganbajun]|uniref:SCP160 protein n=1 Tax=Thelephora ganbajun TaxID=370292 RepID=A0ACB6ZUQ4_THEGA|nr:SCP160 protein [Thelephora ganbajun]
MENVPDYIFYWDFIPLSCEHQQKKHELEGTPDPFPSLSGHTGPPPQELDTGSHDDFPSLSSLSVSPVASTQTQPTTSVWGARPRIKPSGVTESFTLQDIDLSSAGRDGRPVTLSEVTRGIIQKFKVKIEASTNHRKETTFYLKSESQKELDKAKKALVAVCSPVITLIVYAPASTISAIIGNKGATLRHIRERTGARVDIPPKDGLTPAPSNAALATNGTTPLASGAATSLVIEQDEQEANVPITIRAARPLAEEARLLINEIIASRTSKLTQKIRYIPPHILPFLTHSTFEAAAEGREVRTLANTAAREITVTGDREGVTRVVEAIKSTVESLETVLTSVSMNFTKRQHRLLTGEAAEEIMAQSKCAVIVPKPEDPSEAVMVWGGGKDLPNGLTALIAKANSVHIHEFPLPGPIQTSKNILTYILHVKFTETLTTAHSGLSVFTPPPALWDSATTLNLELSGSKDIVDEAIRQTSELIGKLNGATKDINVDWTVHKIIYHKNVKKLKQFHDTHNVLVFFPPESLEQSSLLLVYDPNSPSASPSPLDKSKNLEDVANEVLRMAGDVADVKSQLIEVEKKWHSAVIGKSGTTLNAIIGEDATLSIKFATDTGEATHDFILVRGVASEVDRATKEIKAIVEKAKNDEIDNSFSTEFEIDQEYVGRVVGVRGTQINKIRDSLGVVIHFDQEPESAKESSKKKKEKAPQKSRIIGRQENVGEAKKRILNQVERYADETSEILKIPRQYHSSLIGQNGKYVTRLEDKYGVKIIFPRETTESEGKTRESLTPDEVLVKGGKEGVAGARTELLDALEFEKENDHTAKFTVPTRAIARILGKGGASINDIKGNTGAQIDVDKSSEIEATITVRGTKQGIKEAQALIQEIASSVTEETTADIMIENRFHRSLIGAGGQGLKDLIVRCGGPTEPKLQAGLVRFPRQGEPSDDVRLRGEPKLVQKIKAELESAVAALRDQVVLGVDVPAVQHRALIGRGGQHLKELQNKYSVMVQFPGSRSYYQTGEPENAAELVGADPVNVVRVSGPRVAVEKAIDELKVGLTFVLPRIWEQSHIREPGSELVTAVILVPAKYHHAVTQQGNIFRTLRQFGANVEHSNVPTKAAVPTPPHGAASARIDETGEDEGGIQWNVVVNYSEGEEGDVEWIVKARDQGGLDRACKTIEEAIEHAKTMTHVGFLTMPDRSIFPRIVGSRGANVSRLRAETGADIIVSREDSSIVVTGESYFLLCVLGLLISARPPGSEEAVEAAKEAILAIKNGERRSGRD